MPVKKLVDAIIFGMGASAGHRAFTEIERALDEPEETADERAKREKREKAARELAAKAAKKARAKREAEVDKELAALKKRIGK